VSGFQNVDRILTMTDARKQRECGRRAEDIASWYFRLNGFLTIPGFVVHPDFPRRHPRTEADIIGVRFPFSKEQIASREMKDDSLLTGIDKTGNRTVFILVEVKSDLCGINGPWSKRDEQNMQRVIRRLGFADESCLDTIAAQMYDSARWEDGHFVMQYVCIGARKNEGRKRQFRNLLQINWGEVADFIWRRFKDFPEKLPDWGQVHVQWPDFGREYGAWFTNGRGSRRREDSKFKLSPLTSYLETGKCADHL
jgi:hypothetical protein